MAKPPLGSGERFRELKGKLAKKGARTPGALAAWIGRKKYGTKKMAQLSAQARKSTKGSPEMTNAEVAKGYRSLGRGLPPMTGKPQNTENRGEGW